MQQRPILQFPTQIGHLSVTTSLADNIVQQPLGHVVTQSSKLYLRLVNSSITAGHDMIVWLFPFGANLQSAAANAEKVKVLQDKVKQQGEELATALENYNTERVCTCFTNYSSTQPSNVLFAPCCVSQSQPPRSTFVSR